MSLISVLSEPNTVFPATGIGASGAATGTTAQAANPFVALLSGLLGPETTAGTLVASAETAEGELMIDLTPALPVTDADASQLATTTALDAVSDDILASLPSDIASALADVAQALGQFKSAKAGVDELVTDVKDTELSDDTLAAGQPNADQILTAFVPVNPIRQGFDAAAGLASSADDSTAMASNGLTARAAGLVNAGAAASTSEDISDLLAKPATGSAFANSLTTELNASLNSTAAAIAAANGSAPLSPAMSAMKEALASAGILGDQADQIMNLSAQGAPAPTTLLSSTATAAPLPANSQWTVPGHALLDNSAWSSAMSDRLTWLGQNGMTSASLHITPDDLGPIHVRIQMGEDGAKVAFSADHRDTQGLIERMLPKLNAAFEAQGMRLDDVKVQSGASQAAQMDFSNQQSDQQAQAQAGFGSSEQGGRSAGSAPQGVNGVAGAAGDIGEVTASKASSSNELDAYA